MQGEGGGVGFAGFYCAGEEVEGEEFHCWFGGDGGGCARGRWGEVREGWMRDEDVVGGDARGWSRTVGVCQSVGGEALMTLRSKPST